MAASPSLGSGHQRRQGVGDRLTAAFAANGLCKLTAWVDQIDEGAVVIQIAAIAGVIPFVENMKSLRGGGDLRRSAGETNEARVESLQVLVQDVGGVSLRIDSDENRLDRVSSRAESLECACDLHHGRRADIRAKRIAKIDDEPFVVIGLLCDRSSVRRRQAKS